MESGHLALPTQGQLALRLPGAGRPSATCLLGGSALARGKPERHLALGFWQKARLAMEASTPRGAWKNPSATWHLGGSNARGKPMCHLTPGSWQKTRLAMTTQPPCGVKATQSSRGASHYYYNIITYNKNNIIYTITDNIFSIHTINYK